MDSIESVTERRRLLVGVAIAAAVLYLAVGIFLSRHHSVWSPDTGPRLSAIRDFERTGSFVRHAHAPTGMSPQAFFNPMYDVPLPDGSYASVYTPTFAVLSYGPYRLFGFWGLVLIPAIAGALAALMSALIARHILGAGSAALLGIGAALASPLAVYSVVFWDHSLHAAIVGASTLLLLSERSKGSWRTGTLAGAIFASGLWLHASFYILLAAAGVACLYWLWEPGRRATALGFFGGAFAMTAAWMTWSMSVYGVLFGPHVLGANALGSQENLDAMSLAGVLDRIRLNLFHPEPTLFGTTLIIGCCACMLVGSWALERPRLLTLLWCFVAISSVGVLVEIDTPHASPGLLVVAPWLVLGLSVPYGRAPSAPWLSWLRRATLVLIVGVVLQPRSPGFQWGGRYLVAILPWLIPLAVATWSASPLSSGVRWARSALILAGLCGTLAGWWWAERDLAFSGELVRSVRPNELVVTDELFVMPELQAHPHPPTVYTAVTPALQEELKGVLERRGVTGFQYFGSRSGIDRVRAVTGCQVSGSHGLMTLFSCKR